MSRRPPYWIRPDLSMVLTVEAIRRERGWRPGNFDGPSYRVRYSRRERRGGRDRALWYLWRSSPTSRGPRPTGT